MKNRRFRSLYLIPILLLLAGTSSVAIAGDTGTPAPLVATYDSVADTILAAKQSEWNVVHSILATTYRHAEGIMAQAKMKIDSGKAAGAELENLAELVSQLGNEGDASVAAIRKRLLDGGHHHHSSGEEQGVYDEGFVIVTRAAKKAFLDAGKRIAKMSRKPDAAALAAEWAKVEQEFGKLHKNTKH